MNELNEFVFFITPCLEWGNTNMMHLQNGEGTALQISLLGQCSSQRGGGMQMLKEALSVAVRPQRSRELLLAWLQKGWKRRCSSVCCCRPSWPQLLYRCNWSDELINQVPSTLTQPIYSLTVHSVSAECKVTFWTVNQVRTDNFCLSRQYIEHKVSEWNLWCIKNEIK